MSLLAQIQTKLQQPAPTPEPIPDNVIDIDQRDAFISATLAVKDDAAAQCVIWRRMSAEGVNVATLMAAVKVMCKYDDAELEKRYGVAEEIEMKTAKEWAKESNHKNAKG